MVAFPICLPAAAFHWYRVLCGLVVLGKRSTRSEANELMHTCIIECIHVWADRGVAGSWRRRRTRLKKRRSPLPSKRMRL